MTPIHPPRRPKPVRWQFGIRSRNAPWEALLCIHKALHKLGAAYVPDEDYALERDKGSEPPSDSGSFAGDYDGAPLRHGSGSGLDLATRYKLPADPWHIRVRWESSSRFDAGPRVAARRADCATAMKRKTRPAPPDGAAGVAAGTPESYHVYSPQDPVERAFVALHLDIQIYEMEQGVYLVDFKCSGYETPEGLVLDEKDVTSPFPFLDMAARLIMQLAEAD